jgi:hypothetical protein
MSAADEKKAVNDMKILKSSLPFAQSILALDPEIKELK